MRNYCKAHQDKNWVTLQNSVPANYLDLCRCLANFRSTFISLPSLAITHSWVKISFIRYSYWCCTKPLDQSILYSLGDSASCSCFSSLSWYWIKWDHNADFPLKTKQIFRNHLQLFLLHSTNIPKSVLWCHFYISLQSKTLHFSLRGRLGLKRVVSPRATW